MDKAELKKVVENLLKGLPDNAGGDGLMYKIYKQLLNYGCSFTGLKCQTVKT